MFCINCFHKNTAVTNSRASKKRASVWRRRACQSCNTIFTTIELPSLENERTVQRSDGDSERFNIGRLTISIAQAFNHAPESGKEHALSLAQTVETTLISQTKSITPEDIEAVTHQVLRRFDELAALQYAAKQQLMVSAKKRPGRPSVVSRER